MKKKILVSVDSVDLTVTVHGDVTDVKTDDDYVNVLKKAFGEDAIEDSDDSKDCDGTKCFWGKPLEDVVHHLRENGRCEFEFDFDDEYRSTLQVIEVENVKSLL